MLAQGYCMHATSTTKTGQVAMVCQSKKDTPLSSKKWLSTDIVTEQSPLEEKEEYLLFTIQGIKGVKANTDSLFVTVNLQKW